MYVTASSALDLKLKMEVLTNNLANVNTVGFKEELVSVRTNENLNVGQPSTAGNTAAEQTNTNNDPIMQTTLRTYTNFNEGPLMSTGNSLDFAISGSGFFKIQTPGGIRYTRNGSFTINPDNKLVTKTGALVMGDRGDIDIDGNHVTIDDKGTISVDGEEAGKLKIVNIGSLKSLKRDENLLFMPSSFKTSETDAVRATVQQGYLERSNVDGIRALTFMIESLRLFETYQKVIQTIDRTNEASISQVGTPV